MWVFSVKTSGWLRRKRLGGVGINAGIETEEGKGE